MNKEQDILVFYDFFTQLRSKTELPLDTDQYFLFLKLFVQGYAWGDKEGLRRLCRALWLSSEKYATVFDREFELAFEKWMKTAQTIEEKKPSPGTGQTGQTTDVPPSSAENPISPPLNKDVADEAVSDPPPLPPPPTGQSQIRAVYLELSDSHEQKKNEDNTEEASGSLLEHSFNLNNHFLPVKERRLQQNWRYLRFKAEKKAGTEIDFDATTERCAREAGFVDFVYAPRIEYKQAFHFLIDHDGSMAAFEALAEQLASAFKESLPTAKVYVWYFHNYPDKVLFYNVFHTSALEVETWRARLRKEPAVLFVVSDAGAARGGENFERVLATHNWLDETRKYAPRVLWLNPVPHPRWAGSSATYIASLTPMVDISKEGIAQLPDLLKRL